jgi:sugar lactone lactonase YvrE
LKTRTTKVLVDGLVFPEDPRWHEGKLWFSDIHADRVMTVDLGGRLARVIEVPGEPSGLGWLPDGRLLVVSVTDRRLLRLDPGGLTTVADLGGLTSFYCNDMVVDRQGRAYVGHFGFDINAAQPVPRLAEIILVTPDGEARVVADGLGFPNGCVITPDGKTFVVAETGSARLSAFEIAPDGSLSNRWTWAQFDGLPFWDQSPGRVAPDGICLDAEGAVWVASVLSAEVLRVREGGEVTDRIKVETVSFACMLGGPDRRTLFVCTAETSERDAARVKRSGRIETVEVDVPGAGLP